MGRMKRFILPFSLVFMLTLYGCRQVQPNDSVPNPNIDVTGLYIDPHTGCQYLGYIGHGLTPRLDATGKPMCPKTGESLEQNTTQEKA